MALETLVSGPHPIEGRRLDVPEGYIAAILLNGQFWSVRTPGRAGGIWRLLFDQDKALPSWGNLQYLLFQSSPLTVSLQDLDVALEDGTRVAVEADLQARPVWGVHPGHLHEVVRTYGVDPANYISAAAASLRADFKVLVRGATGHLDHSTLHAATDARGLLQTGSSKGLLSIIDVLNVNFSRDATEEAIEDVRRRFRVASEQSRQEEALFNVASGLEFARQNLESELHQRRTISRAETDRIAGEIYGVSAWSVAHPSEHFAERARGQKLLSDLLTEYSDVIPMFADLFGQDPRDVIYSLIRGEVPSHDASQGATSSAHLRWTQAPSATAILEQAMPNLEVRGSALTESPFNAQDVLILGIAGAGLSRPQILRAPVLTERSITQEDQHLAAHGDSPSLGSRDVAQAVPTATILLVPDNQDKVQTVVDVFAWIGEALNATLHATISTHQAGSRVALTSVDLDPGIDPETTTLALGAWLATLNETLKETSPLVEVTI